jgi:hypothetical protein
VVHTITLDNIALTDDVLELISQSGVLLKLIITNCFGNFTIAKLSNVCNNINSLNAIKLQLDLEIVDVVELLRLPNNLNLVGLYSANFTPFDLVDLMTENPNICFVMPVPIRLREIVMPSNYVARLTWKEVESYVVGMK